MTSPSVNPVVWFELPVKDMERAMKFYETILSTKLERHQMGPLDMAWFPATEKGAGAAGSLVMHPDWYKPTMDGVLIYFASPTGDLDTDLSKVEPAGGKVWIPKKQISPEYGYMAVISDTEGNRVALHSRT